MVDTVPYINLPTEISEDPRIFQASLISDVSITMLLGYLVRLFGLLVRYQNVIDLNDEIATKVVCVKVFDGSITDQEAVLKAFAEVGVIDTAEYSEGILTSPRIQKEIAYRIAKKQQGTAGKKGGRPRKTPTDNPTENPKG